MIQQSGYADRTNMQETAAKPNETIPLRTTINYSMLNSCTKPISWPLPNVA